MKRTVLASGLVIAAVGTVAVAQMLPPSGDAASDPLPSAPAPAAQGVAPEHDGAVGAGLLELLQAQAEMSEAERQAEDDYLSLKLGPEVDVSDVKRVPSASQNQPYRTCEKTPEMRANLHRQGDPGDRAYRDIAGYLSVTNVIATKDCTCAGKIIPHESVAMFGDRLREKFDVSILEPKHTSDLYDEYERQLNIVAAMCGEY